MAPTNSRAQEERAPNYGYGGETDLPVEYLYSSVYHNVANQALNIGTPLRMWSGELFRYFGCEAGQVLALGEIVKPAPGTIKTYAAETAVAYDPLYLTLTFPNVVTTAALLKQIIGCDIVLQKTGAGEARKITSAVPFGAGTRIGIDRPLSATPAATDDFLVWAQYVGRRVASVLDPIVGVASIGAISAGNYGWIQTKGRCENLLAGGAIAAGVMLTSTAAGRAVTQPGAVVGDIPVKQVGYSISIAGATGDLFEAVLTIE